jgi:hypothetical protein
MANPIFQPPEIILQKEELAYGFILEVLTSGLYPNKYHVLTLVSAKWNLDK